MVKKPAARQSKPRTPVAEWVAAALGLAVTLAVVGYSVWEGLTAGDGPPSLSVETAAAKAGDGGFTTPLVVKNASHQTAASVEVRGTLEAAGAVIEERRAVFAYVPGRGETKGGLVFQRNPAAYRLSVTVEGYEQP